jgi:hypothetical protein
MFPQMLQHAFKANFLEGTQRLTEAFSINNRPVGPDRMSHKCSHPFIICASLQEPEVRFMTSEGAYGGQKPS